MAKRAAIVADSGRKLQKVMDYISVKEYSLMWGISERTVRNQCAAGKIEGVFLTGKTWNIPKNTTPISRKKDDDGSGNALINRLKLERAMQISGGIYHRTQIDMAYNSNSIYGNKFSKEQVRHIFDTRTTPEGCECINIDDIIDTINHFLCVDFIIEKAQLRLTETLIKQIHQILKSSTSDGAKDWCSVGEYKTLPNDLSGRETTLPQNVSTEIKELLADYYSKEVITLDDIVDFHHRFETIHPFQSGNGRVGRLIIFKECLAHNIIPLIIDVELKAYYNMGLQNWPRIKGYLMDTCLAGQYNYRGAMAYFKVPIIHDQHRITPGVLP